VPREHLPRIMELEADRMTGLILTNDVVRPELNVVLEEQNQRVANSPAAKLGEQVAAALYLNHPYGRPVIGWRHEIEKLTLEDALEFYRRFYAPNNAIVVIAGDVQPDQVRVLAEQTYGQIARRPDIVLRQRPQEPSLRAMRTVTVADPRVEQPSVQRSYLVPSFTTAQKGESEAIEVLAFVLGGGSNSRLYQTLVVDKRIAVNAGAWYQSTSLDTSRLGMYVSPRPGIELGELEKGLDAVLATLVKDGLTPEELERAKTRLIADATYAQDNQATLARWYGAALTTGSQVDDVRSWPDRIRAVTAEEVRNAARAWLDKERSVTGYLIKSMLRREEKPS
jgi:zinc protease